MWGKVRGDVGVKSVGYYMWESVGVSVEGVGKCVELCRR